jgi:hypothetical protein
MSQLGRFRFFLGVSLPVAVALSGCVANHAYREKEPVLHEFAPENKLKYSLAFVEFDDVGEMFTKPSEIAVQGGKEQDNTELGQVIAEIERINRGEEGPDPVFVVFAHGWKNNASESSGNVWGFRSELQSLAEELAKRQPAGQPPRAVMGIYLGWRGAATNLPVIKEFTFWNRKDAATRIPGAHLTEALRRITIAAKSNPKAKCVVVGHSFGGLVMERTLTQAMVEMVLENREDNERIDEEAATGHFDNSRIDQQKKDAEERLRRSLPDLTVLLNEAGPATESKQFLNFLTYENLEFSDGKKLHPLFLSLTSAGDTATHIIFPAGQFLGKHGLDTRRYEEPDEFGKTDQSHYFLHTTANSPKLVSHTVTPAAGSTSECKANFYSQFDLGTTTYYICPSPGAKNKTPYWVLQIPTEFVPDHSTVFKPELRALLEAFMAPHLGEQVPTIAVTPERLAEPRPSPPQIKLRRKPNPTLKTSN